MLNAHLLALLQGWSAYGYELLQRLNDTGFGQFNKGSIYRALRQLEELGLVRSQWDTSHTGPARRRYELTATGTLFLKNWLTMIDLHRSFVSQVLEATAPSGDAGRGTRAP